MMHIPFYFKTEGKTSWSGDEVFHLMTSNGLFLCRENRFFRATTPARTCPEELRDHVPSTELRFPRIPQRLFEQAVGFFDRVGREFGAEALVLLTWDDEAGCEIIVPPQLTEVDIRWNYSPSPIKLDYDVPILPPGRLLIGDIHSHVNLPAYTSRMDHDDVEHSPGLHIVVGRLLVPGEPPEFEIVVTVDGHSFHIDDHEQVLEGYEKRRTDVPVEWLEQVRVLEWPDNVVYPIIPRDDGSPPNDTGRQGEGDKVA